MFELFDTSDVFETENNTLLVVELQACSFDDVRLVVRGTVMIVFVINLSIKHDISLLDSILCIPHAHYVFEGE